MTVVLHCMETVLSGGVERRHLTLMKASPNTTHIVTCTKALGPIAEEMRSAASEVIELGETRLGVDPQRLRTVAALVDRWQPGIVHGSVIDGYAVGSIVGRWKRVPVVIMEETSDPQTRRRKGHLLARSMAALADHCIAVSAGVGRYLTDYLRIPEHKVSVINNGVEQPATPTPDQLAALRRQFGLPPDRLVIGSVGRLHDETHKRFADLLVAFAALEEPGALLLLVGDGRERPKLEALASALGISSQVRFVGFQEYPGHFYALMDIFALASEREAFGLVNAEAMRCGVPVVATRVGGIPDIVEHGRTGLLVPPRDTGALTAALRALAEDVELRSALGAASKARADAHFSAERYVADVHNLYERLLGESRRRR